MITKSQNTIIDRNFSIQKCGDRNVLWFCSNYIMGIKIVNTETFHGMIRNSWMLFNIDKVFPINMTFDKIFQNIWSLKLGISLKTRFQLLKTFPLIFVKLTSILKHKKTDTPS